MRLRYITTILLAALCCNVAFAQSSATEQTSAEAPAKKGCDSSIALTALLPLTLCGLSLLLKKKENE